MTVISIGPKPETQRVRQEDMVSGVTVYVAAPQPADGTFRISVRHLCSDIYFSRQGLPHIKYRVGRNKEGDMSLRDAGIIPNNYNFNATFFSEDDARDYVLRIINRQFSPFELRRFASLLEKKSFSFSVPKKV